eukprot:TRINITY_DN10143_c0_g1_i1.p1 TRINITY_DN10143_c0_g1~~TRINITY_DN10143_c0_g1_i1.p1  ORF type:complete len:841 (+),score=170.01 TRINITY_DN10143_c0_g1_i1:113-2635(+)
MAFSGFAHVVPGDIHGRQTSSSPRAQSKGDASVHPVNKPGTGLSRTLEEDHGAGQSPYWTQADDLISSFDCRRQEEPETYRERGNDAGGPSAETVEALKEIIDKAFERQRSQIEQLFSVYARSLYNSYNSDSSAQVSPAAQVAQDFMQKRRASKRGSQVSLIGAYLGDYGGDVSQQNSGGDRAQPMGTRGSLMGSWTSLAGSRRPSIASRRASATLAAQGGITENCRPSTDRQQAAEVPCSPFAPLELPADSLPKQQEATLDVVEDVSPLMASDDASEPDSPVSPGHAFTPSHACSSAVDDSPRKGRTKSRGKIVLADEPEVEEIAWASEDSGKKVEAKKKKKNGGKSPRSVRIKHFHANDGDSEGDESEGNDVRRRDIRRRISAENFDQQEARIRAKSMAGGQIDLALLQDEENNMTPLKKFVLSPYFDAIIAVLLFLNTATMGAAVEFRIQVDHPNWYQYYLAINSTFCCIFFLELLLRVCLIGLKNFFLGHDGAWNSFDALVVAVMVFEEGMVHAGFEAQTADGDSTAVLWRSARVMRIVRFVRIMRVLRFLGGFRVLITAILGTLKSCAWAICLLFLTIFLYSLVFAQSVSDHLQMNDPEMQTYEPLQVYFGSLSRSMFTLFLSIIGGTDWENVTRPLGDVGWVYVVLFMIYVAFVHLAVMNVVAGLFLQSAIEQAEADEEHSIRVKLEQKEKYETRLRTLFNHLDSTRDGSLSLAEFEAHLKDEHMQAFLQTMDIENFDAWTLFKLLDTDGGGSVDMEEFVDGCFRLKGHAKSIQMAQIMYHHKWIMDKLLEISESVDTSLALSQAALEGASRHRMNRKKRSIASESEVTVPTTM